MSGYVASARIVGAAPRLARAERVVTLAVDPYPAPSVETLIVDADPAVGNRSSALNDRVRAARERWAQLTFFLFDPNSWR